jgi:tetratricopeptide (TPR) repeat protein
MQLDLAWVYSEAGAPRKALPLVRAVIDWAGPSGDRPILGSALGAEILIGVSLGYPVDEGKLERALALEDWTTRQFRGLRPSSTAAGSFLTIGDLPRARICLDRWRDQLIMRGEEDELPPLAWQGVIIACLSGQPMEAARIAHEAVAAACASDTLSLGFPLMARAHAFVYLGRLEEARADLAEASAIFGTTMGSHGAAMAVAPLLAFAALSAGDPSTVHQILGPLVDDVLANGLGEPFATPASLPNEIDALVALGELEKASQLIDLLAERGRVLDRPWALAHAARGRGLLLAARGDLEGAERAIQEALSQHQRFDMPFELGRTLLAQGQIHRRTRHKRAAKESVERAHRLFHEMGAPLWGRPGQSRTGPLGPAANLGSAHRHRTPRRRARSNRIDRQRHRRSPVCEPTDRRVDPDARLPETGYLLARRARGAHHHRIVRLAF